MPLWAKSGLRASICKNFPGGVYPQTPTVAPPPISKMSSAAVVQTGNSEIGQSAHVHEACGLLQKGAGGDQEPVIKFVWAYQRSTNFLTLTISMYKIRDVVSNYCL